MTSHLFTYNDAAMIKQRTDWPLGPALQRHRLAAGLSVKAAARRTQGQVSDGRWYQLESGYQQIKGQHIPIGTTAATVAAAATAVGWDRDEALRTAGFDPGDYLPPQAEDRPLADMRLGELLNLQAEVQAEVSRRYHEAKKREPWNGEERRKGSRVNEQGPPL